MTKRTHIERYPIIIFMVIVLLGVREVSASTILPPVDYGQMIHLSDGVFAGRALDAETYLSDGVVYTKTRFRVTMGLKGGFSAGEIIDVHHLGGEYGSYIMNIPGMPVFSEGETYLLSLKNTDMGWQTWLLSYGQLILRRLPTGQEIFSHLEEAHELDIIFTGSRFEPVQHYRKGSLLQHLTDVSEQSVSWNPQTAGLWSAANPLISETAHSATTSPFGCVYISHAQYKYRWQHFDLQKSVKLYAAGAASPAMQQVMQTSINGWKSIVDVNLSTLHFAGQTDRSDCSVLGTENDPKLVDGEMFFTFDDPCNQIEDLRSCVGVLAIASPVVQKNNTHRHRDEEWYSIKSGHVIMNNGLAACLTDERIQQVVQHELGHLLGFGHHTNEPANMNGVCCNPIMNKDRACAQYAYGVLSLNPTPLIYALNPAQAHQGERVQIQVSGTGFMPSTTVAIGGSGVVIHAVEYQNSGAILVNLSVSADAIPSYRAFRLTNPVPGGGRSQDVAFAVAAVSTSLSEADLTHEYHLGQNYPNPFNPSTVIPYTLPGNAHVRMSLYDAAGRKVRTLLDTEVAAGPHALTLSGTGLASGMYLLQMSSRFGLRTIQIQFVK